MTDQTIAQALVASLTKLGIPAIYTHHQGKRVVKADAYDGEPIIISDPDFPHLDRPLSDYRSVEVVRGERHLFFAQLHIPVWISGGVFVARRDMEAAIRAIQHELDLIA